MARKSKGAANHRVFTKGRKSGKGGGYNPLKQERTPIQSAVDMTLRQANPRGYLAGAAPMAREIILPMESKAEVGEIARTVDALPGLSVEYDPEVGRAYIGRRGGGIPLSQLDSSIKARRPSPNALRGLPANVSEMYETRAHQALWCLQRDAALGFVTMAELFLKGGVHIDAEALRFTYYRTCTTNNAWWVSRQITGNLEEASKGLGDWTLTADMFPENIGFVWFEGGMPEISMPTAIGFDPDQEKIVESSGHAPFCGFCWYRDGERVIFYILADTRNASGADTMTGIGMTTGIGFMGYSWLVGATMSEMIGILEHSTYGEDERAGDIRRLQVVGAFLLWCKQKILVESHRQAPDRASRRRVEALQKSSDKRIDIQEIKVVTLRAQTRRPADPLEPSGREYSCRWIVRGFWRHQWYPSLGIHQEKYIESYIKGPQEMPLRIPKQTLFAVTR